MRFPLSRRGIALGACLAVLPVLPLTAALSAGPAAAAAAPAPGLPASVTPPLVPLRGTGVTRRSTVGEVARVSGHGESRSTGGAAGAHAVTSAFSVTYTGFDPQQRAAFQQAVDTWSQLITSPVPIKIDAQLKTFSDPSILGAAGPTVLLRNDDMAVGPVRSFYPVALLNARAGRDLNGSAPEVSATFSNSADTFYYGTDGKVPAGKYDFTTIVLHEIGHGLGFIGNMSVYNNGAGTLVGGWDVGAPVGEERLPFVFDRFAQRTSPAPAQSLLSLGQDSSALGQALTSGGTGLSGPQAVAANGGTSPELYSPATFDRGSSYSHLDEATYPNGTANSLMTPLVNQAEVIRDPGDIVLAAFRDMGWRTVGGNTLRVSGPNLVAPLSSVTLTGVGTPGAPVQFWFRKRGQTSYVNARTVNADPRSGFFSTSFSASDDHRYYVTSAGQQSEPQLTQVRSSVSGPAVRQVKKGSTVAITGTSASGAIMAIYYHRASDRPGSFPIKRIVRASTYGTWSRPTRFDQDYRFYAVGPNGLSTGQYVYQAR